MKPFVLGLAVIFSVISLSSCSATQGLAKALGRTTQNLGKTAGGLVNSITR